jgi:hypothetical protein
MIRLTFQLAVVGMVWIFLVLDTSSQARTITEYPNNAESWRLDVLMTPKDGEELIHIQCNSLARRMH